MSFYAFSQQREILVSTCFNEEKKPIEVERHRRRRGVCVQKRVIFTLKLFRKTFKKDLFFICKVHFAEREGETERWLVFPCTDSLARRLEMVKAELIRSWEPGASSTS